MDTIRPSRPRPGTPALALAVALLALAGCQQPHAPTPAERAHLVWLFPGVGGSRLSMWGPYEAFRAAGVRGEIRINEWDRSVLDVLGHLQDLEQNREMARRVAEETAAYWRDNPGARIDLVGYSAGGGVALLVAEALPQHVRVQHVVLVQPGVAPSWDLTEALRAVDGHIVNFYCPSDWLILGAGTKTFGTVDRKKVASAGKEGFDVERAIPHAALRDQLIQREWTPEMFWSGHIGNHISILLYAWNKKYVAPYLLPDKQTAGATSRPADGP